MFSSDRWKALEAKGARPQRPLWASTGVKNPELPDTLYISELIAPGTVNTMPEKTLDATIDHAEVTGDTITGNYADARAVFEALERVGVDMADVSQVLEDEGEREAFLAAYADKLTAAYPRTPAGVLLAFRRVFAVGRKA